MIEKRGKYLFFREQGPDKRYRTRGYRILIEDIPEYIEAYRKNFCLYQEKKSEGVIGTLTGEKGMKIYLGGLYEGVCLFAYDRPIKTQKQLDQRIKELEESR